jgi:hypothetical protein
MSLAPSSPEVNLARYRQRASPSGYDPRSHPWLSGPTDSRGEPVLQLRPNCECCDRDLPPDSADARICSFECTFCADCVERHFEGSCPNCGGNLVPRPIRPTAALERFPPSLQRVHHPEPCGVE